MKVAAVFFVVLLPCLAACGAPISKYTHKESVVYDEDGLRDRAAFDLGCKAEEVVVTHLAANVGGVTGCGKKASYVNDQSGVWVQNSDVNPSSDAK